jgi:hypothetical protein
MSKGNGGTMDRSHGSNSVGAGGGWSLGGALLPAPFGLSLPGGPIAVERLGAVMERARGPEALGAMHVIDVALAHHTPP